MSEELGQFIVFGLPGVIMVTAAIILLAYQVIKGKEEE